MDHHEILQELSGIFREVLNDDKLVLTPELTAQDVPQWDSFNHINIVAAVEDHFTIKFKTAELEQLRNVGEFVELIGRKLNAKHR